MFKSGVREFIEEIESHCQLRAIATFLNSDGEAIIYELRRYGDSILYGRHSKNRDQLITEIIEGSDPVGSMVLRCFTPEIDSLTKLPIKELRGYVLRGNGYDIEFEKLPPETMFACQNTDAKTGEPLPLEQSVKYC